MSLRTSIDTLIQLQEKRDQVRYDFIKQSLLMSSGLLGVLVSLHKTVSTDLIAKTFFALAICLLANGILLLTISLFAQVAPHKEVFLKWEEEVILQTINESYIPKPISGNPPKIYSFAEKIGYFSLTISIINLAVYAILVA